MKLKRILALIAALVVTIISFAQVNVWEPKSPLPNGLGKRWGAFSFSIEDKGYVGTGTLNPFAPFPTLNDFWEYDPATDTWSQKADFPGGGRVDGVGIGIGTKGYAGTGDGGSNNDPNGIKFGDWWEYDPSTNLWTEKSQGVGIRSGAVAFAVGGKAYVGLGQTTGLDNTGDFRFLSDLKEYDPATNSWTRKSGLPDYVEGPHYGDIGKTNSFAFSIGENGYVGGGSHYHNSTALFWEYNAISNRWTRKYSYPGGVISGGFGFAINGKGYAGIRENFWEYDPDTDRWTKNTNFPGSSGHDGVAFAIGNKAYAGMGRDIDDFKAADDFWQFTPEAGSIEYDIASSTFCAGDNVAVNFSTFDLAFSSGNAFTVQLSDSTGSFLNAVAIGTLASSGNSGTISTTIPAETFGGTRYKIRIISSDIPFVGRSYGRNLRISNSHVNVNIINEDPGSVICFGKAYFEAVSTSEGMKPDYEWKKNGISVGTGSGYYATNLVSDDVIACTLTSNSGCASPAAATTSITIAIAARPEAPSITIDTDTEGAICAGTPVTFTATTVNVLKPLYNWFKNNLVVARDTSVYRDNLLNDRDKITCTVYSTHEIACFSSWSSSNLIAMEVKPVPEKPEIAVTGTTPDDILLTSSSLTGNQWFLNDVLLIGEVNSILNPFAFGDYKVQATVDGCSSEFSDAVPFIVAGNGESINAKIGGYPSPVDDKLTIDLPRQTKSEISIFRTDGSHLTQIHSEENRIEIDVSNYTSGIYLVRIIAEEYAAIVKFIKR